MNLSHWITQVFDPKHATLFAGILVLVFLLCLAITYASSSIFRKHIYSLLTQISRTCLDVFKHIRKILRVPHNALMRSSKYYRLWHEQPHHLKVHRRIRDFALVSCLIIISVSLVATYQPAKKFAGPSAAHASGSSKIWGGSGSAFTDDWSNASNTVVSSSNIKLASTSGGAGTLEQAGGNPPGISESGGILAFMDGTSSSNIWAGGSNSGLVQWNGSGWVDYPNIFPPYMMSAIVTPDSSNTYASDTATTNIHHWNGSSWETIPDGTIPSHPRSYTCSPGTPSPITDVRAMTGTANDCLAVGSKNSSNQTWAHWDGSSWTAGPADASNENLTDAISFSSSEKYVLSNYHLFTYNPGSTTYTSPGLATASYAPGGMNKWTGATPTADTTPSGTGLTLTYCDTVGGTYVSDITSLPRSTTLYIKADLTTSNSANTPTLSGLVVDYDPVTVTVSAPNGGENIKYNNSTTTAVSWSTSGTNSGDLIHLQYSTNSGSSYSDITGATALDPALGSYNWTIYNDLQTTSATVKVKAILENSSHTELANDPSNAVLTLTYDNTPPVLTVSETSNNSTSTVAKLGDTISAIVSSNEALSGSGPAVTIGGTSVTCTLASANTWNCSRAIGSGDSDGLLTTAASGTDLAGNPSGMYSAATITVDKTPPTINITFNGGGDYITHITTLDIGGTAADTNLASVTMSHTGDFDHADAVVGTTSWSQMVSFIPGDTTLTYTAHDTAGNTAQASIKITVDITSPSVQSVTVRSSNANPAWAKTGDTITWTITASEKLKILTGQLWEMPKDGSGYPLLSCSGADTAWVCTKTITANDIDGNDVYNNEWYKLYLTDLADNTSYPDYMALTGVSIDQVAPIMADFLGIAPGGQNPQNLTIHTKASTYLLSGSVFDNYAAGIARVTSSSSATLTGTTSWSQTVSLADGNNSFTYTATDIAGNQSALTYTVVKDPPITPTIAITSPSSSGTYQTDQSQITVAGTVIGATFSNITSSKGTPVFSMNPTDGTWYQPVLLSVGVNTLTYTATSVDGVTATAAIRITSTPPINPPTTPATITIDSPTGSWIFPPKQAVTVKGTAHGDSGATVSSSTGETLTQSNSNGTVSFSQTFADVCSFFEGNLAVTYTVKNKNDSNQAQASIWLRCQSNPTPIRNLVAAPGSNFITVSFAQFSPDTFWGFSEQESVILYRSTSPDALGDQVTEILDPNRTGCFFIDTHIKAETYYYYSAIVKRQSDGALSAATKANPVKVDQTYSIFISTTSSASPDVSNFSDNLLNPQTGQNAVLASVKQIRPLKLAAATTSTTPTTSSTDGTITVILGQPTQVVATVIDNFTNQPVQNPTITWSLDGSYATITQGGLLSGVSVGGSQTGLTATFSRDGIGVSRVVPVYVVSDNVITGAALVPGSVTLKTGTTQQYRVDLTNQNGTIYKPSDLGYTTTYSATGGTIDSTGLYTAGTTQGNFIINAVTTNGNEEWYTTARVTISNDKLYMKAAAMVINPRVPQGTQYKMWSYAYDQFNNLLRVDAKNVHYSNSDPEIGYIDNTGMLYANNKEKCDDWVIRVDYEYDGKTAHTTSRVNTFKYSGSEQDTLANYRYLSFTNNSYNWVVKPGEKHQYSGYISDGYGTAIPGKQLIWEMADPKAGSITQNGVFTASQTEKIYVRAIKVSVKDVNTGVITPFTSYAVAVSNQGSKISRVITNSVVMKPYSYGYTTPSIYDQFGFGISSSRAYFDIKAENGGGDITGYSQVISGPAGTYTNTLKADMILFGSGTTATRDQGTISAQDANQSWPANWCSSNNGGGGGGGGENPPGTPPGGQIVLPGSIVDEAIKTEDRVDFAGKIVGLPAARILAAIGSRLGPLSVLIAILTMLPLMQYFFYLFIDFLNSLLQYLAIKEKSRSVGKVLKGKTKDPVVAATVQIIDSATQRVIDSERTDSTGEYIALIEENDPNKVYTLSIVTPDYAPFKKTVHFSEVNQVIRLGVSLENNKLKLILLQRFMSVIYFLDAIRIPLLILGTFSWLCAVIALGPTVLNYALGIYYLLAWLLEWYISHLPRPYGLVMDEETISPLPLVVIRITNQKDRIVATEVTNIRGQFKTLLPRGIYTFTFSKADYVTVTRTGIILDRQSRAVNVDVEMVPLLPEER